MSPSFGIPNDPTGGDMGGEFDSFRRKRQNRKFRNEGVTEPVATPSSRVQREIETEERKEIFERQIAREVQEFVEQTTRIAARILSEVEKENEQNHSEQIHADMREFFQVTLSRAEAMLHSLRSMDDNGPAVAELETHLQDLATATLDQFRAEGTEVTRNIHVGERPATAKLKLPQEEPGTEAHLSMVGDEGWTGLDEPTGFHEVEDEAVHLSSAEDGADEDFVEAEADGDGGAQLKASGAWRASREPDAGLEEDEVLVESDDDPFQVDAPMEAEAPEPAQPEPADDGLPPFFAKWRNDPQGLKKALTVMVKNGLMTGDEAREIFRKAKA
ncbi:MAG: hypothetical protein R3F30_10710 [Planctomycetota bacterium]